MSNVFTTLSAGKTAVKATSKIIANTSVSSSASSIAAEAAKSTYYFPILVSKTVSPEAACLISESLGYVYMDFMRACFAMHPGVVVHGDVDLTKYLKRFHQNSGINSNGYILDTNWNAVLESAYKEAYAPFKLFPNDSVNIVISKDYMPITEAAKTAPASKATTATATNTKQKSYEDIIKLSAKKWESGRDVKRSNGMAPIVTTVTVEFIIKNQNQKVSAQIPIGVKTVIHSANSEDYIDRIIGYIANNKGGTLTSFIRWTSGEVNSLGDMLFGTKDMKSNLSGNDSVSKWFKVIEERKKLNAMPLVGIAKRPFLPNMTMVISTEDADEIKRRTGIDLLNDVVYTTKLMKECMLLGFVIIDNGAETAYVLYDSHNEFDEVPFETIARDNNRESNDLKKLLRAVTSSR